MAEQEAQGAMEGTGKTQYVTRLMKAKCSFGSMSQYLNLPLDHGVWFQSPDTPIMNANDHEPEKHILHFGRCTSSKNPGNTINLEEMIIGALFPFGGFLGSKLLKKLLNCEGCKCKPMTITPWKETDEDYYIDGAPAVTVESTLQCYYGGSITIDTESETKGDENTDETVETEEKGYHSTNKMPASMADKINDFCSGPQDGSDSAFDGAMDSMAGAMSMYAVSPEKSAGNYANNKAQQMPPGAVDAAGNIIDSSALGNYKLGNGTVASQGDGVVAAYNAVNMLFQNPDMASIIRFFELLPYIMGNASLGEESYGLVALLMYMMALNYNVSVSTKKPSGKGSKKSGKGVKGEAKRSGLKSGKAVQTGLRQGKAVQMDLKPGKAVQTGLSQGKSGQIGLKPAKEMQAGIKQEKARQLDKKGTDSKNNKQRKKQVAVMGSLVSDTKGKRKIGGFTAMPVLEESGSLRHEMKDSEIMVLIGEEEQEFMEGGDE